MPMHNAEIADLFDTLADLLEIEDANPFRIRAYRNAALTIRQYARSMKSLIDAGEDLTELPAIGDDLAKKIQIIVETGKLPLLEEVRARTPAALSELMAIEGLGPKRVKALYKALKIRSLDDLKRKAKSGKIRELEGFGEKTEAHILEHIERYSGKEKRMKLAAAEEVADGLCAYLKGIDGVKELTVAGSYRRRKETVGDLDILVTARKDSPVMRRFAEFDEVAEVISRGKTRSSVVLRSGLHVDLRVVPQVSYGAALQYFTGSREHNIEVRRLAVKKGYKINEYGVFDGDKRIAGKTEKEIYATVGLPCIEPELRENRGEIEAGLKGKLPKLIELKDIRGDLHCHTIVTDGRNSIEEMALAARELGYEYLSINDHSRHVTVAKGLDEKRLRQQLEEIDALNDELEGITILKSIEVDILEDGKLDLPDSVLRELDFTVCAVHYKFNLPRDKQTDRIIRAMDNPLFIILAHPSGRLIDEREGYDVDMERVMLAAKERGCHLEVNAQPARLDLTDIHCKAAREIGLKFSIATDSHSTAGFANMRFGIDQARRGWLEAADVLNTCSLKKLRSAFQR
ncbi:MAG TPA: DNA polymerase/3'-5' exonuclease PolX [Gammaproteobacteria bacterium]